MINLKNVKFYILFSLLTVSAICYGGVDPDGDFLPEPTGEYAVGTYSFTMDFKVPHTKKKHKRLTIKVWYPSDEEVSSSDCNLYLENYDLEEIYSNFKKMGITRQQIADIATMRTHSAKGIAISKRQQKYPLLIFTPGYYFGANDIYSAFIENMASNGSIVISVSHVNEQVCEMSSAGEDNSLHKAKAALPYLQMWWRDKRCLKDYNKPENQEKLSNYYLKGLKRFNRKIIEWEESISYVVSEIESDRTILPDGIGESVDFENSGMFGQSFGGSVANDMCVRYDFVKSAVNMDGFQFGCVSDSITDKPMMLIEGEQQLRWRIGNEYIYRNYPQLNYIKVFDSLHFLFSDLCYYDRIIGEDKVQSLIGNVKGKPAINWLNKEILDFFDSSLKNKEIIFFDGQEKKSIDGNNYLIQKTNRCIFLK